MALEFIDTDSDGIDVGDPTTLRNPENLSWCAWIYPYSFGANSFGRIFQKYNIGFIDDVSPEVECLSAIRYTNGVNDQIMRSADNTIVINQWQHVGAVHDTSDPFLVINGSEPAYFQYDVGDGTWFDDTGYDLFIGNRPGFDRGFDGLIADFRIYNKILTIGEMQAIYHLRGADTIIDGLIGGWKLDELSAGTGISTTSVIDFSKNKNNGLSDGQNQTYAEGILKKRRVI